MKLRNFMYATMIACAFASCSKDDVVGPDGPDTAKGNANFTVVVKTPQVTKAVDTDNDGDEEAGVLTKTGEDVIKSLTLVVFDASGNYLASGAAKINNDVAENTVNVLGLAPQAVSFRLLANMPDIDVTTLKLADIDNQVVAIPATGFTRNYTTGLPMSSETKTITLAEGDNYYGYASEVAGANNQSVGTAVALVRNVSRVDLADVTINMDYSNFTSGKVSFQFSEVSVQSALNKVSVAGAAVAGAEYWSGVATIGAKAFYKETPAEALAATTYDFTTSTGAKNVEHVSAYFYVLANTANATDAANSTKLVIKGHMALTNAIDKETGAAVNLERDGFYPITIGYTNNAANGDVANLSDGLTNNKVYKIKLIVAGLGKVTIDGGDPANFFVQCAVQEWAKVDQSAIIK